MTHTPGPWKIEAATNPVSSYKRVTDKHGRFLFRIDGADFSRAEDVANAHLSIAAPELLDTLLDCEIVLDSANRATKGTCNAFILVLEKVRSAIIAASATPA